MIQALIKLLFPTTYTIIKLEGRFEGWQALEDLIERRAVRKGSTVVELIKELMQ